MRDMNVLNVYQINIFQILRFMYKVKHNLNPRVVESFEEDSSWITNIDILKIMLINQKQQLKPLVVPYFLVDHILGTPISKKAVLPLPLFRNKSKSKLLESENEFYFSNTRCEFARCNIAIYFLTQVSNGLPVLMHFCFLLYFVFFFFGLSRSSTEKHYIIALYSINSYYAV